MLPRFLQSEVFPYRSVEIVREVAIVPVTAPPVVEVALVPVCAWCPGFVSRPHETHTICPRCAARLLDGGGR